MSWLSWFRPVLPEVKKELENFTPKSHVLSQQEEQIVQEIRHKTEELNCNNVKRTMAYLEIFERNPELEWALLAHMVSRNAGWSMTDVKGDWCSRMLEDKEAEDYFRFLERANWLIFQDAYPQLLLYEHCKKWKETRFHLLQSFHVSRFMQVMWQDFWIHQDKQRLTMSLIINEQNYIECRVLQKEKYAAPVFHDIKYYIEDWLDLCMILFPAKVNGVISLFGKQVNSFPELANRIQLGKQLYSLLFSEKVLPGVLDWCKARPHTGSREDYWPDVFSSQLSENLSRPYVTRFKHGCMKVGVPSIYSPRLQDSWPNVHHEPALNYDWYQTTEIVDQLQPEKNPVKGAEEEYGKLIEKLEMVVGLKQRIID